MKYRHWFHLQCRIESIKDIEIIADRWKWDNRMKCLTGELLLFILRDRYRFLVDDRLRNENYIIRILKKLGIIKRNEF